jgi:hypothetical protein
MEINRLEALRDAATHGGRTVMVAGEGHAGDLATKALLASLAQGEMQQAGLPVKKSPKPSTNSLRDDAGKSGDAS